MKKLLLIVLLFVGYQCWGQTLGNMLVITQTVPPNITICGEIKQCTVTVYNPSPFLITNCSLNVTLPTGIIYENSCNTPGFINSFGGIPKFNLPNIPTLTSITLVFCVKAQCNVLQYIGSGGIIKNTAQVYYTANGINRYDVNTSSTYVVKQPNLAITSISNQSYVGNIGDVFTRCITVINGGFGELSSFTLTDVHAAGIQINSMDKGTLTQSGLTAKVILSGTDFMTIGDGDALFEGGESITICENVTILDCISGVSSFKAFWGCSVNACQSAVSSANVVFPNYVPNLVVTPTASMNSCLGAGNASPQQLRIINKGLGKAINVVMDIFQATSSGFNPNLASRIDETSFTIQVGLSATPTPITPTSTQANSAQNCVAGSKGRVGITIPTINAGDTVYLKWNSYTCCTNTCSNNTSNNVINGWRYKGTYSNLCQTNYVIYETWGRTYSHVYGGLTPDGAPSTLSNGQTGTFNFLFSNYGNSYPVGPGAYWKFVFTLPNYACISYSNIKIVHPNGTSTWVPTTVTAAGNIVTAIFNSVPPFNLTQAELKINLTLLCTTCTGTEVLTDVSVKSYYIPNNTCACEVGISCQSIPFNINCPDPCPAGILFSNFDMSRTSYGKPDNLTNSNNSVNTNGGDGLADASGSLNFSKIKTNRVMYGDTVTSVFYGVANTNLSNPTLPYIYASSSISNGNLFGFLDANLRVYRGGTLLTTCNNITPSATTSGTTREFLYDISVSSLNCSPQWTDALDGDSLVLTCRYKDTVNIGNAVPLNCFSTNKFYSSAIPNPSQATDKLQCGTINGNCTVIGFWFRNWDGDNYGVKSCDNNTITQNYHLSIGPGHNNDAGGNLFPYEYRNWAHIQNLTATVPEGYTYISARFMDVRTAGTLTTSNSGWIPISPVDSTSDTLVFNVEHFFQGYSGTIPLSDDGFYGVFEVIVQPSCEVTPGAEEDIEHIMDFETTSYLSGSGADTLTLHRDDDHIIYDAPDLFVQSPLPSILATDSLESWDIIISNSSNVADAMNTWIGSSNTTGINIVKVEDVDSNNVIPPSGAIYPLGTVPAMGTRTFRITATHTSCNIDSIIIYSGWNCSAGYPASVSSYPCTPERITLMLTPLTPGLLVDATGPTSPIQLCDTATFVAIGTNAQLGTAYQLSLTAYLPAGAILIPGSSQLSYPDSAPFVNISDPVNMGSNQWKWNISASDSLLGADGLKGILDTILNTFKIKFRVSTSCGFTSGNNINFTVSGIAACGDTTDQQIFQSSDLDILGASDPYNTSIRIVTTYVSPCATNSTIKLVVNNQGPTSFGATDSVVFKLPGGVSYVANSFAPVHNSPPNGLPVLSNVGGYDYLTWRMPAGVGVGDSSVFTFQFAGEPVLLTCGIVYFEATSKSSNVITCSVTGNTCATNIVTGDTSLAVFIYKAYLAFGNGTATSIPNPPGGETITMTYEIINTGQAIAINADSVIQYYFDADGNGMYSVGDEYIAQDTVLVPKDTTIMYTTTFDAPAGKTCSIIAVVDPGINNCVCEPTQTVVQPKLLSLGNDTVICSGETITMSSPPVTGYTYSWTPTTNLSNGTISDAIFTASNNTVNPVTTNYSLFTNRGGCTGNDTIAVTVNPLPTATVTGTITVCKDAPSPNVVFTGAIGPEPYTFVYTLNGDTNTVMSTGDTAMVPAPTSTPGDYVYTLISVQDSSSTACYQLQNDSVVVVVNPLPTAAVSLGGVAEICQGGPSPSIVFVGSGGVPPYTFTYSINNGASQTVNSTMGDSGVVFVSTSIADTFSYKVTNIQDASNTVCSQVQNDSVIVIVNPLPVAIISGSTAVCRDATPPLITFVGTVGTAPFIFNYQVNNDPPQTVTSTNGDTAFVPATTSVDGLFVYKLLGVTDSSSTTCYQPQNDSVTVIVDPLPTATIHGTDTVCQYAVQPGVTFVGFGGVAPYTFTYTLNGVLQPSITTIVGDSITIFAPTNATGIFTYSLESVTDSNTVACTHPQTGDAVITVNPRSVAAFTTNKVCNGNATQFTDSSSTYTGSITTWSWDLDDGSPLNTGQNPLYVYSSAGTYNVTLIVNNSYSCPDTLTQPVQVYFNPVAGFTFNDVCLGDTVIFANTSTVDTSTSISSYIWVFGDGVTGNLTNPVHYYSNYGTYNVTLVATTADGCSGVANLPVKTFDAPASAVQFSNTCLFDSAIFINTSQNPTMGTIASWSWDFGDGSAIETNTWSPLHLYSTPGDYEFTLITHSSNLGCPDTLKDSITVFPMPIADFSSEDICLLQNMNFYDSSTVSLNSISGWIWDFGDNTAPFDTTQNPVHLYATATNFDVQLIAITSDGCKDTVIKNVVVHPLPDVDYITQNVCDGTTVNFNDATSIPPTDTLYSWMWNFGDSSAISNSQNTSHLYDTAGAYVVSLIVTSTFGCVDSISKTSIVNPNPVVGFTLSDTADCEPFCINLTDNSNIALGTNTVWVWDFGDGTPTDTGASVSHCYINDSISSPVYYSTTLTVTSDSGCVSTLSQANNITVYPKPEANFIITSGTLTIINPVITITDLSIGTDIWEWDFGDSDTSSAQGPYLSHEYADTGTFNVTLITTTQYGCKDTAYQNAVIEPDFVFYVPNAFSPNDDGKNDTFTGKGVFIIKFEMWIFDRWGNMLFYSDDYNKPWDGKANGGSKMAQRDVYVYTIKVTDIKQVEHIYTGSVTLVQ
ncbi:MAG: PKD domain-containing protein [Bacteroidia bacterium]